MYQPTTEAATPPPRESGNPYQPVPYAEAIGPPSGKAGSSSRLVDTPRLIGLLLAVFFGCFAWVADMVAYGMLHPQYIPVLNWPAVPVRLLLGMATGFVCWLIGVGCVRAAAAMLFPKN